MTIPLAPEVPPVIVSPAVKAPAALVTVRVGRVALLLPLAESYTAWILYTSDLVNESEFNTVVFGLVIFNTSLLVSALIFLIYHQY